MEYRIRLPFPWTGRPRGPRKACSARSGSETLSPSSLDAKEKGTVGAEAERPKRGTLERAEHINDKRALPTANQSTRCNDILLVLVNF
jgi:hypothetical protein